MKIQCISCEAAEAKVLCCVDEAALCCECDEKVHSANKLAGKHQRVSLLSDPSSFRVPKCDICQEFSAYFFCLEDRAILCQNCDVAIHKANPMVSLHQRFLLTGIQVGLEATCSAPATNELCSSSIGPTELSPKQLKPSTSVLSLSKEKSEVFSTEIMKYGTPASLTTYFGGTPMAANITDWPLDELFRFADFNPNISFADDGSSYKADSGKLGSSGGSLLSHSLDEEMEAEECLGQVPEIPSPPTASGLHWPRNSRYLVSESTAAFVPDITSLPDPSCCQERKILLKRRRLWHR